MGDVAADLIIETKNESPQKLHTWSQMLECALNINNQKSQILDQLTKSIYN